MPRIITSDFSGTTGIELWRRSAMTAKDLLFIKLKGRSIGPHKALMSPAVGARNVLTNSPWTYVALWLKRGRRDKALLYWQQAQEFYKVSLGLPPPSAPLPL